MITFSYSLKRKKNNKWKEFTPTIPTKLDNIIYIEGPNSFGKSTLLHIVALACFGEKNTKINPALKDKLKSLLNNDRTLLKFSLEITTKNKEITLISEKLKYDQKEIIVKEINKKGERKLQHDAFDREYNLIYDIPDNPTKRIELFTNDIQKEQNIYGTRLGSLKETVRRIIGDIRNARDPERINVLQTQLNGCNKDFKITEQSIEDYKKQLDCLEDYTYERFFSEYKDRINLITKKIDLLRKKISSSERKVKHENIKYNQTLDYAKVQVKEMQQLFENITSLLSLVLQKDKHYLNIWEKIDLNLALSELQFDDKLEDCILHFKKILNEQLEELDKDVTTKEADLYNELLSVLENYTSLKVNLPGVDTSINEFITALKKAANKTEMTTKLKNNINQTDALLAQLKRKMEALNKEIFPDLNNLKLTTSFNPSDYIADTNEEEIGKLQRELKELQDKYEIYENKYASRSKPSKNDISLKCGKKLKEFNIYTEEQLNEKVNYLIKELSNESNKKKNLDHTNIMITAELDRLKNKKPHKYQNSLTFLNKIYEKLNLMDSKIKVDYTKFISDLMNKNLPNNISREQEEYNEIVFAYLGNKIGRFRHIDEEFTAFKVDVVEGCIYVDKNDENKIFFDEMGTGQTQSAYLKGLLNTKDDKKIIALFDEIAMMDSKSLEPIYQRLRQLNEEGKLLIGILVQRNDNHLRVISRISSKDKVLFDLKID